MGGWTGIWQWVVVLAIVLLLFGGRGKVSQLMGDFGKGLKSFKKGLKDDDDAAPEAPKAINSSESRTLSESTEKDRSANH